MQAKQAVQELLDKLPDDCTIDEILYQVYVVRSVEQGKSEIEAGQGIPHAQVVEELRREWLTPGGQ